MGVDVFLVFSVMVGGSNGYIVAIRNMGLVRFQLVIYTLSCENP
jgi:hypothetical protein